LKHQFEKTITFPVIVNRSSARSAAVENGAVKVKVSISKLHPWNNPWGFALFCSPWEQRTGRGSYQRAVDFVR